MSQLPWGERRRLERKAGEFLHPESGPVGSADLSKGTKERGLVKKTGGRGP